MVTSSFHVQKAGNAPEENEDAFAFADTARRLAIADGASDSYDSGRWAHLLTAAFVASAPPASPGGVRAWLDEPARAWLAGLRYEALPWNQQAKARLGAHCTLLGVEIDLLPEHSATHGTPCGAWRALAVGDCCLFQVRAGDLIAAFPLASAAEFGSSPPLLTTNPAYRGAGVEQLVTAGGELRVGDTLLLATDALAQWFLRCHEQGERQWRDLPAGRDVIAFIAEQRSQRRLRNDDVTMLVARIVAGRARPSPATGNAIVLKGLSDRWLSAGYGAEERGLGTAPSPDAPAPIGAP